MIHRRTFLASALAVLGTPNVARAASRKMRLGHNNSATSPIQYFADQFRRSVVELTGGDLDFDIYPAAQLGNDTQLIQGTADGALDATISGSSVLGALFADCGYSEIPYMFRDVSAAHKAFDGPLGLHLEDGLAKTGLQVMGWGESGFRHISANRPVRTPADLKGLKIRVQPAKLQTESFRAFGAAPEAVAFSDLPEALKVGRVEAQENPTGIIVANEFIYRQQTHVSLTGHVYSPFALSMSADVLAELKADQRKAVIKAGKLAAAASRELSGKSEQTNIEKLKSFGVTIISDVDVVAFQKVMNDMKEQIAIAVGADGFNRVRGLLA